MANETQRHSALQMMLEDLDTGIAGLDADGRILCANGAFYVRLATSGLAGDVAPAELRHRLHSGSLFECCPVLADPPARVRGKDGRTYRVLLTRHDEGPLSATVQILRPVCYSECGGMEDAPLPGADGRAGRELLRRFAHETRTMLTNIIGFAELMRAGREGQSGEKEHEEWATYIRESSTFLLEELGHLTDLVNAMEAPAEEETECMSARELVEALAGDSPVRCLLDLPDEEMPAVCGDLNMLVRGMGILCRLLVTGLPGAKVRVILKGNDKDVTIRLSRVIAEVAEPLPERAGGGGCGGNGGVFALPLARAIVTRHGGTLEYHERGGGEACYEIRLPACMERERLSEVD